MDHWGDPWADNANDKSPTKNAVTSPLPPAFTFAPVPLNGFVDDAGWGNNDDDGFGDWTTPNTGSTTSKGVVSTAVGGADPGSAGWGPMTHEQSEDRVDQSFQWPESPTHSAQDLGKVVSEPSDSSTVSQLDAAGDQDSIGELPQLQTDVESSVRSSTSPSETSRIELPIESPRTSIEDERATRKEGSLNEALFTTAGSTTTIPEKNAGSTTQEGEKDLEDIVQLPTVADHTDTTDDTTSNVPDNRSASPLAEDSDATPEQPAEADAAPTHAKAEARPDFFVCDKALLAELFPTSDGTGKQLDEHDDPIFSTSSRKAWYRLTRKQTLREFNHGDNDDNYIRVTWTNSHVRAEAHKVVSRWAREDRISGTGPGARASFYWDTPAPAELKAPFGHSRSQSSMHPTKTVIPTRQNLPPLASDPSAAFNWSSSAPSDPWKSESATQRSTSSPLAPENPIVTKLRRQEGRAVSVDLTPRKSEQAIHKRTATVSHSTPETTAVASLISPSITQPPAEEIVSLDKCDEPSLSTGEAAIVSVDDDDDWGEMVQTPTLPTQQQLAPLSQLVQPKTMFPSPPLSALDPPATTKFENVPIEPTFAAPIVRLQSTISPTSALFKANSFVPLNAEQGPIGPGILKPANRAIRSPPHQNLEVRIPEEVNAETSASTPIFGKGVRNGEELSGAFSQPALDVVASPIAPKTVGCEVTKTTSSTPIAHPATPVEASADSWADADFSFFESKLPAPAKPPLSQAPDPSDPLSFFDTPTPPSIPPSKTPFSRSPPRDLPPPLLQPLTGATSSVQRRKAEEEDIINSILSGLSDLSYMLRE